MPWAVDPCKVWEAGICSRDWRNEATLPLWLVHVAWLCKKPAFVSTDHYYGCASLLSVHLLYAFTLCRDPARDSNEKVTSVRCLEEQMVCALCWIPQLLQIIPSEDWEGRRREGGRLYIHLSVAAVCIVLAETTILKLASYCLNACPHPLLHPSHTPSHTPSLITSHIPSHTPSHTSLQRIALPRVPFLSPTWTWPWRVRVLMTTTAPCWSCTGMTRTGPQEASLSTQRVERFCHYCRIM